MTHIKKNTELYVKLNIVKLKSYLVLLFLSSYTLTAQQSNQCLTIDFETLGNINLYEGLPINNQFFDEYGVTFELENGTIPLLAEVGGVRAFAFSSIFGNDTPAPNQKVGRYFITDDGLVSNLTAIPLIVRFENPVDSVSAEVLDMDFDEVFTVTARDKDDNTILTKTIKAGDVGTGDGIATVFGFNIPGCIGTIYSLKFEGTRQASGGFGFAMDNFSFCFTGVDIEKTVTFIVDPPDCDTFLGSITPVSNGSYDLTYSLDNITFFTFEEIKNLPAGDYLFYLKTADGCEAEIDVNIPDLVYPNLDNVILANTTCGKNNGMVEIFASGNELMYSIDNGTYTQINTFNGLSSGNHMIIVENNQGCRDTTFIDISPSIPVVISSLGINIDLCRNATGEIEIKMATAGVYRFFINDVESTETTVDSLKACIYKISIRDGFGCLIDTLIEIIATPDIILSNILTRPADCRELNGEISFTVTAGDSELSFFLDDNEVFINTINGLSWGQYELVIQDEYGCVIRSNVNIARNRCPIYLPNIISGHTSSVNNNFIMKTLDDYNVSILRYRIYDRWGNLVFISGGFSIHDQGYWWNGYFNGKEAVNGVYCYVIDAQHPNGDIEYISGDVTLIR